MNEKKKPILGQEAVTDARTPGHPPYADFRLAASVRHVWRHRAGTHSGSGLRPALSIQTTLLMAGLGTLLFHVCTKFKVPRFPGLLLRLPGRLLHRGLHARL